MKEELSDRLKSFRQKKGFTQAEISRRMGFASPIGYLKIENGQTKVTLEHLEKLAEVFGISLATLLGMEEPANSAQVEQLEAQITELKTRITELEDRLRDKERIIRLFESRQG